MTLFAWFEWPLIFDGKHGQARIDSAEFYEIGVTLRERYTYVYGELYVYVYYPHIYMRNRAQFEFRHVLPIYPLIILYGRFSNIKLTYSIQRTYGKIEYTAVANSLPANPGIYLAKLGSSGLSSLENELNLFLDEYLYIDSKNNTFYWIVNRYWKDHGSPLFRLLPTLLL